MENINKRLTDKDIQDFYDFYNTPEHVKGHCRGVTDCAMKIAEKLNEHGHNLDLKLIYGAGMVHDSARLMDEHWNVCAARLEELGFHDEAAIVKVHMDPTGYNRIEELNEKDMVCIGDRLVKEDQYVGIDERFEYIMDKARKHGLLNFDRIMRNKGYLQDCLDQIEKEIGQSVDSLFGK